MSIEFSCDCGKTDRVGDEFAGRRVACMACGRDLLVPDAQDHVKFSQPLPAPGPRPIVIGHRGACGYRPELTAASFELAVAIGADAIETDLVCTRDGVLVCRHDVELSLTTDVAGRPEFAHRRTTRTIDGQQSAGWFVDDFSWPEIQTLRARERWPFRDHSFDGQLAILRLSELLDFVRQQKSLNVLLEIKHPTYFGSSGFAIEQLLLTELQQCGFDSSQSPVIVESFETSVLRRLREQSELRLIQLIDDVIFQPFDLAAAGDARRYADLIAPHGLEDIAQYAMGIGVWKRLIVPAATRDADAASSHPVRLLPPTSLIEDAHAAGLHVHAWTFRTDPQFLAQDYGGNPRAEYAQFLNLGVDGLITDFPDAARGETAVRHSQ